MDHPLFNFLMIKYHSLVFYVKVLFEAHFMALFFSQRIVYNQPGQACSSSFLCKLIENKVYFFFKWTSCRPLLPPPRDKYLSFQFEFFSFESTEKCFDSTDSANWFSCRWGSNNSAPNLKLNFLLKVLEIIYNVTFMCSEIGWKRTNHGPL